MFRLWLICVLLMKIASGLRGSAYLFADESVGSPVVSTTSGRFSGLTIRQTNVWIGIPYATPPVDGLRWRKAQPYVVNKLNKKTIQNATQYGPSCLQIDRAGTIPRPLDEDCLYLNVWAPYARSSNSKGYPVMIWIHGGGLIQGSASQAIYDGLSWTNAAIQANTPFILVSFNYRLNVMGFFSQPSLLDVKQRIIANQGITDQRMAMEWVRSNIAQFGGDANRITLMGQSAGSHSVCVHMVSPLSRGLFNTGIMESGPCDALTYMRDKSFAYSTSDALASLVGCNIGNSMQKLACLQTVDGSVLVDAIANVSIPPSKFLAFKDQEKVGGVFPFAFIVDGVEIPIHPLEAFLSGRFNRVPLLIGANHDEFLLRSLYRDLFISPTSQQDYETRILPVVTYDNSELQALYSPSVFNGNYMQAYVALMSQMFFICGSRRIAGYMNEHSTYLYTYTHAPEFLLLESPSITVGPGAYHAAELFNLFQTLASTLYGNTIFTPDELPLATSVRRYWTYMITTDQPNNNIDLKWPHYSCTRDQAIVLDKNITTSPFLDVYPNCDLLSSTQVKSYEDYLGLKIKCVGNKCYIAGYQEPDKNDWDSEKNY